MRIAVYTGTFDPLHIGHLAIMRHFSRLAEFGAVYLIVSPKSPFKDRVSEDTGRARYEAAVEAVRKYPDLKVKVDDIELHMPSPQYTVRTLDALAQREPRNSFTLIMGADNLADLKKWREGPRILTQYGVAVYPREGIDLEAVRARLLAECPEYKIEIVDAPQVDVSSTLIRARLAAGEDASDLLM